MDLWEKVGNEQLAEPSSERMTARDWIQAVRCAVESQVEEEEQESLTARVQSR